MDPVLYEFESVKLRENSDFIFQTVRGRRMTDVYHEHDFYEVVFLVRGFADQLLCGREKRMNTGEICILRPSDKHCFISQSDELSVLSLSIKKARFRALAEALDPSIRTRIDESDGPICFDAPIFASLVNIYGFENVCEPTEPELRLMLLEMLGAYDDHFGRDGELPQELRIAAEKMKLPENISGGVSTFSALSHYSKSHLARLCERYYGMSPKKYINSLRMERAYHDIVYTDRAVIDISDELGFSSFSHFSQAFKKYYSVTPSALRKKSRLHII